MGSFSEWRFAPLVMDFVRELESGRLEVACDGVTRNLWLETGEIRAVASSLVEERMGEWLTRRGVLNRHQLSVSLDTRHAGEALYGTVLVQQGFLGLEGLQAELEERIVTIFARLLPARGEYRFFAGEAFTLEAVELTWTTAGFLMAAARSLDDLGGAERLLGTGRYLCAAEDALMRFQRLSLTPEEAFLLTRIDGTTTLAQLPYTVPLAHDKVLRCVVALAAGGLVEARERPAAVASPAEQPVARPKAAESVALTADQHREYEAVLHLAAEAPHLGHYQRLRLPPRASVGQVGAAFRILARTYHPDRANEPHLRFLRQELVAIYQSLVEARDTLVDPARRSEYDRTLAARGKAGEAALDGEAARRLEARRELVAANVTRAHELIRLRDFGGAVVLLEEAARFDPKAGTLLLLARLEFRNPMWANRALANLQRAVALDPTCTDAWLELAAFWARRHDPKKRRQCLEKALAADPSNLAALDGLKSLRAAGEKRKERQA